MKYYDNQTVRRGDKCVAGTFGSCKVIRTGKEGVRIKNVITGEVWELDSMRSFDLTDRKKI